LCRTPTAAPCSTRIRSSPSESHHSSQGGGLSPCEKAGLGFSGFDAPMLRPPRAVLDRDAGVIAVDHRLLRRWKPHHQRTAAAVGQNFA
jgi:hypothetical protein